MQPERESGCPTGIGRFPAGRSLFRDRRWFNSRHTRTRRRSTCRPPPVAAGSPDPRPATTAYKNVQVLTGVDAQEFMRLQRAITQWVSPTQGCGFCHAGDDYASDERPQKQVTRVMLRMTRHINAGWQNHVGGSGGVTCYTCHRGQPVPSEVWFPSPPHPARPMIAKQDDWNEGADTVRGFFPRPAGTNTSCKTRPASRNPTRRCQAGRCPRRSSPSGFTST